MKLEDYQIDYDALSPDQIAELNLADINSFLLKIQKNPDHYADEVSFLVKVFLKEYETVKTSPGEKNDQFYKLLDFFNQVFEFYTTDLDFLFQSYQDLLKNFSEQLERDIRFKLVYSLVKLSKNGHWNPVTAIKFFLDMLAIHDKDIKKLIFKNIVTLVSKVDEKGRKSAVHKELLDHFAEKTKDPDHVYAKNIFKLLISLMFKEIWKDAKVANLVAEGTHHDNPEIAGLCCKFFVENIENEELDISSDEEAARKETIKKGKDFKHELIHKKKTKSELNRAEKIKKEVRKAYGMKKTRENMNYYMIELLYSPLNLCEKVFAKLKTSKFPFKIKLLMMHFISRLIWKYELIFQNYFLYLHRYIKTNYNELPQVLACLAGAVHPRTPLSEIQPLVRVILLHFANEAATPPRIAMGVNTLKEISIRCHESMDEDDIYQVCLLRKIKHKFVSTSVRSFINVWRTLNVKMLKKEYRGRFWEDQPENDMALGSGQVLGRTSQIDGIELLREYKKSKNIETEQLLTDEDFKLIKKLKKLKAQQKEEEEKLKKGKQYESGGLASHQPDFDFTEERKKLKQKIALIKKGEAEEGDDEMEEEGEEEMEGEEEGMEEEGEEEEGEEGEEGDMMAFEGVEGMDIEEGEEENDEMDLDSIDISSDESQDITKPSSTFLSPYSIYDPEKIKKKMTREDIKKQKTLNRNEHKQRKLGSKLKERGRLTNQQKKKNNPYQMFIQKKRLTRRLQDLKSAKKQTTRKLQKGHSRVKLGSGKGKHK